MNDSRRDRRLPEVVAVLAKDPQRSICAATGGWAETMGAYRLLNNEKVTPAAILGPHQAAVAQRCEGFTCVVVAQDTTEMDFTAMKSTTGLGPLNDEKRRGFYLHGLYAVSEQGLPLGIYGAEIILRDDANFRINSTRKNRAIEEKESYRWVEGTQPAYLICTDPELPLEELLQEYIWRWHIEVNHRDEKTILGVGKAQVRNKNSVEHIPATAVAAYSLLHLAAIKA